MKVFTVGLNEKPHVKDNPVSPDGVTLTSTPIITLEKKRNSYKVCNSMKIYRLSKPIGIDMQGIYRSAKHPEVNG